MYPLFLILENIVVIDLYKDWTPEQIKALINLSKRDDRSKAISEGVKRWWRTLSPEEYSRMSKKEELTLNGIPFIHKVVLVLISFLGILLYCILLGNTSIWYIY